MRANIRRSCWDFGRCDTVWDDTNGPTGLSTTDGSIPPFRQPPSLTSRKGDGARVRAYRWAEGKQHGQGALISPGGSHFRGEFRDGRIHGSGRRADPGGSYYEGEYQLGKRHGRGRHFFAAEGLTYDGEWIEDRQQLTIGVI